MSVPRFLLICSFVVALSLPAFVSAQDDVSFVNDVAPIINAKCGRCHVASARGQYRISTFKELIDGGSVKAKKPDRSLFIKMIENGKMPKGGAKVDKQELETLRDWIEQGAKFDGTDETQSIAVRNNGRGQAGAGRGRGRGGAQAGGAGAGGPGRSTAGRPSIGSEAGGSRAGRGQSRSRGGRRPSRQQNQPNPSRDPFATNKLIQFFDLNSDGQLSLQEIDAAKRLLYSLDANEDDRLTADELKEFGAQK